MFNKSKSPETFISETLNLKVINENILYITHRVDSIYKLVTKLEHLIVLNKDLQKQVDDYFDETSHQTDFEDKEPD